MGELLGLAADADADAGDDADGLDAVAEASLHFGDADLNPDEICDGLGELLGLAERVASPATASSSSSSVGGVAGAVRPARRQPAATATLASGVSPLPPRPNHDVVQYLENGARIIFFKHSNTFEATCGNSASHGRCRLTRSAMPPQGQAALRHPFQGRPLALLYTWACNCSQADRKEHLHWKPTFEERLATRRLIIASSAETLRQLAASERERFEHEGEEPEILN